MASRKDTQKETFAPLGAGRGHLVVGVRVRGIPPEEGLGAGSGRFEGPWIREADQTAFVRTGRNGSTAANPFDIETPPWFVGFGVWAPKM